MLRVRCIVVSWPCPRRIALRGRARTGYPLPMRDDVKRRALRATAKVAWAGLLLGCRPDAPAAAPQVEPTPTTTAREPVLAVAPPASEAPTSAPDLARCEALVDAAIDAGLAPEEANDAEQACCRELQKPHDATWDWRGPRRAYCCPALAWRSGGACTPWGPPMPPALSGSQPDATPLDLRAPARHVAEAAELAPVAAGPLRAAAVATWRGRMVQEHGSSAVFEGLAGQLRAAGFPAQVVAQCAAMAGEERRHGVLCGAVVEALGGEAIGTCECIPFTAHTDVADDVEAVLRNLLSVCCLSETVAVALIGAERLEMPLGALRRLLSTLYGEEIGHARFGWHLVAATLAERSPADRAALLGRLNGYLRRAFAHLEAHELEHLPLGSRPPPEGAALGLCDGRAARGLFYDAVEQVIVPSLAALGFDAETAWRERRAA